MTLEEVIISSEVLFNEENGFKAHAKRFLEFLNRHAERIILLNFQENYAEPMTEFTTAIGENSMVQISRHSGIEEYLLDEKSIGGPDSSIYITSDLKEIEHGLENSMIVVNFGSMRGFAAYSGIQFFRGDFSEMSRYFRKVIGKTES